MERYELNKNHIERDIKLDVMKTLLVAGMITAHVFQLCYNGNNKYIFFIYKYRYIFFFHVCF